MDHLGQLPHVEQVMEFRRGRQHLGLNFVPERNGERHQLGCHVHNLGAEGCRIKSPLVQKYRNTIIVFFFFFFVRLPTK